MLAALAQLLGDWHEFYILVGTAAATLVGLQFVAVSLAVTLVSATEEQGVRVFVTPTLVHFTCVFLISALLIIPRPDPLVLGGLFGLLGLVGVGLLVVGAVDMVQLPRRLPNAPKPTRSVQISNWLWYFSIPLLGYLAILASGLMLVLEILPNLVIIAVALLLLLVVGIRNAWFLLVWISRQHRAQ